jgi:mannose-1-phosphate guanylyltransferase
MGLASGPSRRDSPVTTGQNSSAISLGDRSLLTETRRRVGRLIPPEHLLTVVVRKHERFYEPELCGAAPGTVVVQPENCGTAPAILYALSRLAITAPTRPVAIVPSDH